MTEVIWNRAFDLLMFIEGGYVNDPRDRGGETNYGISKKAHPKENISEMTIERAKEIYRMDYWLPCRCDVLPDALAVAVFDFAVNSSPKMAIKFLQGALGVKIDGIVGNQTIGAASRLPLRPVLKDYMDSRLAYLMGLKDWKIFGNGWGTRVKRVREFCEGLI